MERYTNKILPSVIIILIVFLIFTLDLYAQNTTSQHISAPGQYSGYSEQMFDNWQRSSRYLSVRDGTKLAVDIFRPTKNGLLHQEPLPVIWEHRRYQRASQDNNGNINSQLDREDHPMRKVVLYGYIYAVVAVRGSGASFGTRVDPTPPQESLDAYDITEWLASQSWCNGNIGMYGISYSGTAQFMAASACPPHLKAIFPEMAMFDLYNTAYPGGILRYTFINNWANQVKRLDLHLDRKPAPVDSPQNVSGGNSNKTELQQALEQHKANFDVSRASEAPYRDSIIDNIGNVYIDNSPSSVVKKVNKSGVAVYQRAGWFDMYPRDMLLWFNNLNVPKKIVIGPWNHYQSHGLDRATEILRWYDYWLKGIDNGIMNEPPIMYGVIGLSKDKAIRLANEWPPKKVCPVTYYFCKGPSDSIDSANDGLLKTVASDPGIDRYKVDYTTTSGTKTRWSGGAPAYSDMTVNDRKALTYTTASLTEDTEIVGHPVIHLWVQCPADDLDVFAYLEELDTNGISTYITDGCLRASHRRLSNAPFRNMDLPYHRSYKDDIETLSNKPVELVFDLHPTANLFEVGHRIRISVACADRDNYQTPKQNPIPEIIVYRNDEYSSYAILPVCKQ